MACSSFWKFDKIDKIGISIILIFFSFFSVFNTFSFASTDIPFNVLTNASVNATSSKIVSSANGGRILYFPLEENSYYRLNFHINAEDKEPDRGVSVRVCRADSIEVGTTVEIIDTFRITDNESDYTYDFNTIDNYNVFLIISLSGNWFTSIPSNNFVLTKLDNNSFNSVIDVLSNTVGISQLWDIFEISIPYILVVSIVSIGFLIVFNIIRGLARGKGRI